MQDRVVVSQQWGLLRWGVCQDGQAPPQTDLSESAQSFGQVKCGCRPGGHPRKELRVWFVFRLELIRTWSPVLSTVSPFLPPSSGSLLGVKCIKFFPRFYYQSQQTRQPSWHQKRGFSWGIFTDRKTGITCKVVGGMGKTLQRKVLGCLQGVLPRHISEAAGVHYIPFLRCFVFLRPLSHTWANFYLPT